MTLTRLSVTMFSMLRHAKKMLMDILFPRNCHLCLRLLDKEAAAFDGFLCSDCVKKMAKTQVLRQSFSAFKIPVCDAVYACYVYDGPVKELIHKYKYGNRPYLVKSIVALMADVLKEAQDAFLKETDCLVPVPLHPVRFREREFNQSELLADRLSQTLQKPVVRALNRTKNTPSQVSLSKRNRLDNMKGAFSSKTPSAVEGKNVLLIDDVVTTAATALEASRVLKDAGARCVRVLAFAKG